MRSCGQPGVALAPPGGGSGARPGPLVPGSLIVITITLALFAFHLWASWRIGGPSVVYDEAGYLGNARWLAGGATWDMPTSPAYAAGYSLLLAPVMVVFDSPDAQWRAVLVVNAMLLASLFPVLVAVATKVLGARRRPALIGAALGAMAPAVVAAGVSAIAENLVLPLVALSVLAAWAMVQRPDGGSAGWPYGYGLTIAALVTTHPRFTAVVAIAAIALVVAVRRGVVTRRVALVNGASLAVLALLGRMLNAAVVSARWTEVEKLQGYPRRWLKFAQQPNGWGELALSVIGQAWYLAVGTLGLAVVGLLAAWRATRIDADPTASRAPVPDDRPRRFALGVTLASAAAVFATSVVFFAQNQFRADHWVYGRHNDSFSPLWILLAVTALLGWRSDSARRVRRDLLIAAAVTGATGAALIIWRDPTDLRSEFSPFAVPGLIRMVGDQPSGTFWKGTALGLVGAAFLALVVAAMRWRQGSRDPAAATRAGVRGIALAGLGAVGLWFAYAGFGVVAGTDRFETINSERWHAPADIDRFGIERLSIEGDTAKSLPMLTYPFNLPEVDVSTYSQASGEDPEGPFVLARLDDQARLANGDRVLLLDDGGFYAFWDVPIGLALWVMPGPEQDALLARGHLLPDPFPNPLPASARSVELDIVDDIPEQVRVAPGGRVMLTVTGRHTGSAAPWPDFDSYSGPARVRVVAEITPERTNGPDGARSGGELTQWVRPGESFDADVTVVAVDTVLQPLPPGRYRVRLGVGQDGADWFATGGPGAEFTMVVAGDG